MALCFGALILIQFAITIFIEGFDKVCLLFGIRARRASFLAALTALMAALLPR